jgi:hypothetical protein
MNKEELNAEVMALMKTPDRLQEFTDLASPEANWSQVDKRISVPRSTGTAEIFCPICFDPVRLIFDKFAGHDLETPLLCPHCKTELVCKSWFVGFTNEVTLEERR